jgi:hypothetical protein
MSTSSKDVQKSETEVMLEAALPNYNSGIKQHRVYDDEEDTDEVEDTAQDNEQDITEPEPEETADESAETEKKPKDEETPAVPESEKALNELKTEKEAWLQKEEEYTSKIKELEQKQEKTKEANKAIIEAFEAEPVVAEIMKDIVQGLTIRQAFNKYFDPSDLTVEDGDPDEEDIKKLVKEREKAKKEREDYFKTLDENKKQSEDAVNKFVAEYKLNETDAADFFNKVDKHLMDAYNGKLTKEFFDLMKKGFEYDQKIEAERKAAEIKARNEKIEIEKDKKKTDGDGLPKPAAKTEPKEPKVVKKTGFMGALERYEKSQTF